MQEIIVFVIVLLAVVHIVRSFLKSIRGAPAGACTGGCGDCRHRCSCPVIMDRLPDGKGKNPSR